MHLASNFDYYLPHLNQALPADHMFYPDFGTALGAPDLIFYLNPGRDWGNVWHLFIRIKIFVYQAPGFELVAGGSWGVLARS
jgi:hypothetical protein